jgi:tRNA pseudouridine55 synthase
VGVLVVDKPGGMTSHDVVGSVRRLLGTRRVGHAGTLDPMATGVLVVLIGEATKLGPYLTADDKRYAAGVTFGRATDTLDAEGSTTATAEVPAWLHEELREASPRGRLQEAIAAEVARTEQVPPVYSAIHVDGRRSHDRARAGEDVELTPRPVAVREVRVVGTSAADPGVALRVEVSKGYYVRSLARDLGDRLGVPAHLSALRREASGSFTIADAVSLDAGAAALRAALIPIAEAAARALPVGRLTAEGAGRARQGQRLSEADFAELPPFAEASAWLDLAGLLVAIGARKAPASATDPSVGGSAFVIHRGFSA